MKKYVLILTVLFCACGSTKTTSNNYQNRSNKTTDSNYNQNKKYLAINEVSILRQSRQAASLSIDCGSKN